MHHDLLDALSTGWIEEALGVSRAAVSDWRRGKFPERRRAQLEEAVRAVLADDEAPPPQWVTGLPDQVAEKVVEGLSLSGLMVSEAAISELAARLGLALQPPDGPAQQESGAPRDSEHTGLRS